jgi:hypothetical protein
MTVREMLATLQRLPRDAEVLALEAGVAAGVDLHLQAAAALSDHAASVPSWSVHPRQKNDKGLPASKQGKD